MSAQITQVTAVATHTDKESLVATSPSNTTNAKVQKPKKKSKKLCNYKQCTSPHSIIGDCNFCFKKFCTKHRLLESHDCEHYKKVQQDYHDRNAKQLEQNKTIVTKV